MFGFIAGFLLGIYFWRCWIWPWVRKTRPGLPFSNTPLGQTCRKCQEAMCPDNTEVLSLAMFSIEDLHLHLAYNFFF